MFNWKKHCQSNPQGGAETLNTGLHDLNDTLDQELSSPVVGPQSTSQDPQSITDIDQNFTSDQIDAARMIASSQLAQRMIHEISKLPYGQDIKNQLMAQSKTWQQLQSQISNPQRFTALESDKRIPGLAAKLLETTEFRTLENKIRTEMRRSITLYRKIQDQRTTRTVQRQQALRAFNLSRFKIAQVSAFDPYSNFAAFNQHYLDKLLMFHGNKNENDSASEDAKFEILKMVSPAAEEEANAALEKIQSLSKEIDRIKAESILKYVFDNWVAPSYQQ